MSSIQQILLAASGTTGPPPTPLIWNSSDQTNTVVSGSDLVATFVNLGAVRSTSTRNSGKRQVNFRFSVDNVCLIGVANASADTSALVGFNSTFSFALYLNDGNWYSNSTTQGSAVSAVAGAGGWMALIFDWSNGKLTMYTDPDGSPVLRGASNTTAFAGQDLFLIAGSGSGSGTRSIEINPAPSNLVGGAIGWNT